MGQPRLLLLFIFGLFKQTSLQFLQKYVKNVIQVYGAGIRTHDLWNMIPLPLPPDQGSRQGCVIFTFLCLSKKSPWCYVFLFNFETETANAS